MQKSGRTSIIDKLEEKLAFLKSDTMLSVISWIIILVVIIFMSGITYIVTTENPIPIVFLQTGAIRVFLWSINMQTHAETIVVMLYYLMGAGGVLLYMTAVTRTYNPRTLKYMLFFSFLLILLASLGLYSAYISKFTPP